MPHGQTWGKGGRAPKGASTTTSPWYAKTVIYEVIADGVVLAHAAFVVYVVLGGLLTLKWRRCAWVHVPCALWGTLIEFAGWVCPLTPLENWLRVRASETAYTGGFVEQYLLPALYPDRLTRSAQVLLGAAVLALNACVYGFLILRWQRDLRSSPD